MDVAIAQSGLLTEAIGTIAFQNGERVIQAIPRRLARHEVSFEVVTLDATLRTSEVLSDFSLKLGGQIAYTGRATITAINSLGTRTVCTVALEDGWTEPGRGLGAGDGGALAGAYDGFLECWQKSYHVPTEFKVVVADMQFLLADLELWLAQFDLELDRPPGPEHDGPRTRTRIDRARSLGGCTTPTLNALFEKFETAAATAGHEQRP